MNTYLLYRDREPVNCKTYFDAAAVVQDLSLHILFRMASRQVFLEKGEVKTIGDTDFFVQETMRKVMIVPLRNEEEIRYRQAIIQDCVQNEQFIRDLYGLSSDLLLKWDALGRREKKKTGSRNMLADLVTEIHVLNLFVQGLKKIKALLKENAGNFSSEGLTSLCNRMMEEYSDSLEASMDRLTESISFFVSDTEEQETRPTVNKPHIVISCAAGDGMKLSDICLVDVATRVKKYRDPNSAISKMQDFFQSRVPDAISFKDESPLTDQAASMEYEVVRYIVNSCTPFMKQFFDLFEQLKFQTAFYVGAVNLKYHMERFELDICYPDVCAQNRLAFDDLKEFVMCIEQRVNAVGNTCDIDDKMLLIVTGANQGGKSTFLRSIGIAQVMMQCGLMVTAKSFQSGIFPGFFTHFTRREDSAMNSGRLDEELGRMNLIIENLEPDSLILLNESFATTTEKEGSVIAYDIIKALKESGVKILTVTHLLSFATKVYDETKEGSTTGVAFLSAEREEDGRRTFKMIDHEPELTSFGLDLYESIILRKEDGRNGDRR